jgi:hypothetical protein
MPTARKSRPVGKGFSILNGWTQKTHSHKTKSIQATVWELLLEDVVDATEFVGASMLGGK